MRKRKKLWRTAVVLLLTAAMVLGNGAAVLAMGEKSEALDSSLAAAEVITSLSYYDAANGPSYSLSGVDNVTFGFVMPKFNGKPSSELPLTDVLGDLELQVKVDGNWQNIDNTPYFVFNSTWGWEHQDWGGWICWFKVTETTYLRFHGKTNDVNLPYTLNFTKLEKVTVTSLTNTEPDKTLSTVGGGGIDKGLFIINGDRSIKYDQAADDIDILVKRESESEFVPLFDNPESKWIYDQNFGVYTEGNGGWWFNNVEESFTVRFQAKSNSGIYTEFHMTYIKPNRSNTKLTPFTVTKFDAYKPNHEASIGIELPKIDGTPAVKADLEGFVYQICVGATYDRGTDRWSGGEWKDLSDTGATGWVYQGNGYSKYSTSSQWGYWVDYIYGLWFQPVKEDTYLRIGYPADGTVGGDCGDNYVYYTFIGDPDAVIPNVSDMADIPVDTGTSTSGDVNDSDITVPGGWEMIWHDEFNGNSVDNSKWSNQTGFLLKEDDITTAGWGNNELEYYTDSDENTSIEDGKLKLTMLKDPKEFSDTKGNTATALYSSGKLISQNKFSVKYGRVDFRAKVPAGKGIWPALWMMPNDNIYGVWASSGEIDVFEGRGRTPELAFGTLHYGATWPGNRSTGDKLNMVADGNVKSDMTEWHVYSLVWEEGNLKIYCDGKCYFKCTNETWYSGGARGNKNAPFDQRFYLIMNLAAGGAFDGNIKPGDDFSQADMYVDYVRVYQKPVAEGEDEKPDTLEGIVTNGSSDGLYGDYKLDKAVAVENITLSKSETSIVAGSSEKITAIITPEDASNKTVAWSSSDTTVAKVSGGTIMALKPGTATITATTGDGGKTAACEVTVTGIPVTGVALDKETLSLKKGESEALTATVTPLDASNKNVIWESSDASVVKVDGEGRVTAVKTGTATISVTTEDGSKTAACEVTVLGTPVTGVALNSNTLSLEDGDSKTLTATVIPSDAANKNVSWESSDVSVVKVDGNGKIRGVKAGTATITVTTEDGGKTAACEVTVTEKNTDTGRGVILKNGKVILYVADLQGAENLLTYYRIYDTQEAAEAAILNNLGGYAMVKSGEKLTYTIDGADLSKYLVYAFQDAPQTLKVVELSSLKDVGGGDENPDTGENLSGKGCIIRDGKVILYVADSPGSAGVVAYYRYYDTLEEANRAVLANLPGYNMSKKGGVFEYDGGTADTAKYLVYAFNQAGADIPKVIAVKDIPAEAGEEKTASYIINIYRQNKTKDAYELTDTQNKTGTVGDTVTADTTADTGFTYNPLAEGSKTEGTVTNDGKLELAVFYDRDKYEITYYLNGGENHTSNPKEYIYGAGTATLLDPVKEGCTFEGWYQNPDFDGNKTTYIGTEDTGNVKLYAKWSENGNDTIEVTGITLDFTKLELKEGESKNLKATVEPEDATNKDVEFTSTDTTVATVDGNGKVTAVKAGTATITVTAVDGSKTASCQVIVMAKDTPKPSNPGNSSSADSSQGDSAKTISTLKVDFITDKEAKEITANIWAGLQVRAVNHILEITAGIPISELHKGFTSDYPMNLNITMDTDLLLKEIEQADEKDVQLSIVLPKEINENKNFLLSSITLDKKVLTEAAALKKDITVLVKNEKGETEYFWDFDSDVIHEDKNTSMNLLVEKMQLIDDKDISELLNLSKEEKVSDGNVINIKDQSTFPWVSTVTLSVDEKWELQQGKEVYLYRYNEKTKKLEELPDSILQIAKDGTVDVSVIQGGKYVILSKKADSKIITPLTGQIKVSSSKKIVSVKSGGNIKVTLPSTIITVKEFTKKDSAAVMEGKITYKSGNASIAAVTSTGRLTGKKPGKTTIYTTVQLKNGTKKTYKSVITVK